LITEVDARQRGCQPPQHPDTAERGQYAYKTSAQSERYALREEIPHQSPSAGTKGKTTTSALTHALLATDAAHPAVLGGNIGKPLVERVSELTPDHRVVVELSELQLPTLSRGTTVAAYTNVTADHLDRHGSLEAYRAVKRRLGELVDPDGAIVLNDDDPVGGGYAFDGPARVIRYRRRELVPGGVGLAHGWIVADAIEPVEVARRAGADAFAGGRILPLEELAIPGEHNVANALAALAAAIVAGAAPEVAAAADGVVFYRKRGCPRCGQTGYKGRIGVYQLLVMSETLETLAAQKASREELERAAIEEGMRTLWDDGLSKVAAGMTSLEELTRVTV